MDWEYVENDWKVFKGKVKQNWDQINDQQLDMIAGKRDRLVRVIQRTYNISQYCAEEQLSDWQSTQINIDGHYYTSPSLMSATC